VKRRDIENLVITAIVCTVILWSKKKIEFDSSKPETDTKKTGNGEQRVVAHSNNERRNTEDQQHRAKEERYWERQNRIARLSFLVSAGALFSAIVAGLIAHKAYNASVGALIQATRQADAAFADQRPWLRVNLTLIGFRILENADSEVTYHFDVKNVGRSPARNIRNRFETSAVKDSINSIPDQKRQCDLAQKDATQAPFPGAILFAGENAAEVAGALNLASNSRLPSLTIPIQ
jgi:hypothetical protein